MGLLVLALGLGIPRLWASERESDEGQELLRSDSGSPYVHRITLYDHQGEVIDPEDESAGPYSPRMTCAKCHPYAQISGGWHFNAPNEAVPAGRPGERWLLVDPLTGTQLPISGRKWPGTFTPEDVGLTNWEFVKTFGRHIPGGGYGEPDDEDVQNSPESVRWSISGRLEIDCMFCHAADQQHDPAEAARQIEKENFKWAATAALGLAVVRGEARKAPDDWDPLMEPDPDFPERAGPRLVWNTSRFDADNRVLFEITRRPSADRCYFCHSFREVGAEATAGVVASQDVHLAAGLTCVDCHRNELDHMMARGYGNEADERGEPELAVFSCEGCHLGVGGDADAKAPLGGRYGAPHPQHRGLSPLHFEKLTCTACHSGPWPEMDAKRFQTSLAHGLGLASRERKDDDPPHIVGPVFARQRDGKIAPQRLVWPRFWAWEINGVIVPLSTDELRQLVTPLMNDKPWPPSTETIGAVLGEASEDAPNAAVPVLVAEGRVYVRLANGQVHSEPYTAATRLRSIASDTADWAALKFSLDRAGPYCWSIAHNVRPASQSLGVRGCTDCHANDAPFYFGRITDAGDAQADARPMRYMHEFRGDNAPLAKVWGFGFAFRPAFKWFGFVCAGLTALILLHYALAGIGAIARRFR